MKKKLLMALAVVILSLLSIQNFAQAPVLGTAADYASFMALAPTLGTAADFVLFTAVGAVGDTPISQITGNVGTNSGAITGFGNVNGVMHTSDGASGQCAADLLIAYNQLNSTIPTFFPAPLLGNGQVFNAGVYKVTGASTLNNELILDAQNDPNAVFIIQIEGTFSTAANSKVTLANQAMACNVFWKIEGLVDMASGTTMRGTVIANNAAINMNAGGILEGRALSTGGAVNVSGVLAYTPIGCGSPVLMGPAAPDLVSAACYAIFSGNGPVTNAGISYVTGDVGTNVGLTTGFNPLFVTGMIHPIPDGSTAAAAADLLNAYNYLSSIPFDIELLYPAQFGHNLVLTPHTYLLNAATSLTDTLYLNGGGQEDAIFVIKIFGALNTSNYSKVVLTNGTLPGNVFWVVEGAVNITDYSIFKGTVIANNGAVELGTGANIDGRAFTTTGAIGTAAVTVTMPPGCGSALPPAIVTGPENQTVCEGDMVSFTVSATGDGLEYQWRKGTVDLIDGLNIFGSTTDSLTINPVLLSDAALDYNVVVTGTYLPAATSENVSLIVQALPVIEPMADTTICENDQQYIIDVIASNYSSLTWTTTGTGTFNPLDIEDVSYSPSAEDILSGFVELCVTANPEAPCIGSVTECFVLTFQKAPAVYAGADATIPTGMDYTFDDATAANYSSLLWTGGLGIFDDDALLDATYTPALGDNGTVMFVLTAQAINPCTLAASDNVYITYQEGPMVYAGSDETICDGSSYQLAGTAQFVSSVLWSGGLGTFDDPTLLSAIYTPAVGEIGSVTLTLTGYPIIPSADPVTDVMVLTLQNAPVVYAGADAIITRGMSYTFADATATNYSSLLWTGGLGTFDDATMLNATYTPALGDNGSIMLVLTAQPINPCTMPVSDNVNVTIQEIAIVDAGADAVVCEGIPYQLAGTAQFVSSVLWSGGLGTFDDPTLLSAIYTPAVGEIGSVTLTLTGYPIIPSADPVTDVMVLTLQNAPVVYAGADAIITRGMSYTFADATATNYSSLLWTGGLGTFDDATMLNATYTPALGDNGSVMFVLTAQPVDPCTMPVSDNVYITYQEGPMVYAGSDETICDGSSYQLAGTAQFVSSVLWSGGLGTFDDPTLLSAIYTPAVGEIGSVTLTLTGYPIIPSADPVTDVMVLTLQNAPVVYAGADAIITRGMSYTFADATATNYSSLLWTGGLGTFDDATMLNATYTPALGDNGSIMLVLTAQPINPCTMPVSDNVNVTIQEIAIVDAGADAVVCEGIPYQLAGTAQFVSSVLWSGGLGTFDDPTLLSAIYTPAVGEIGSVTLTLTGYPIIPSADPVTDAMVLTIQAQPVVNAGTDMTVCDNVLTIQLTGTASNNSGIMWHGGNGFFDDDVSLTTFYNVDAADIAAGSVTLCLTATPIAPCQGSSVDCITITFDPSPTISNLQDATICDDVVSYCFTGVSATNYSSLLWTGGDGAFDNATTLNPCYTPGAADVLASEVILTLTAQPIGACNIPAVESMTLYIVGDPTIELDAEIYLTCANYDFELEQWLPIGLAPIVTNAPSVLWTTTSVDGFFDNPAAALTSYNVGMSDKWNGSVTLTLTAYGDENCGGVAEASIIIYIPQQIIEVLPGTVWRGISSYVDKSTTSVAAVMDPVVVVPGSQSLVIMHIQNGKYFWPAVVPAVNQLGLWQPVGYKARFKAEGCLPIYGDVAYDTVGHNLAVSGAITYVPCLTNYPVAINDLFDGFENQILLIYSWEEGTMWVPDPNVVGPLNFIRPGSAYMMVNKAGANYSVTFPSFDFNAATVSKAVVPAAGTDYVTPWNTPANTAQPHFILFADEVISSMQAGDIVGAFDRYDECVGTTEIGVKTDLNKLLAMGDDPSTEAIDGYQDGENMTFKLYRPSTDETFDVTFTYDANYPSYDNKFAIYGVSNATGMTTTLTSVNELVVDRSINVYPNPAKEVINITSDYDLRKVTLVNYVGQTVFSQVVDGNNFQINVSNFVNGMYFVRIETVQGNVVTKPISIQ